MSYRADQILRDLKAGFISDREAERKLNALYPDGCPVERTVRDAVRDFQYAGVPGIAAQVRWYKWRTATPKTWETNRSQVEDHDHASTNMPVQRTHWCGGDLPGDDGDETQWNSTRV